MNLLMISGDRSVAEGRKGAFWYTLEELQKHFSRIDVITPRPRVVPAEHPVSLTATTFVHPAGGSLWSQASWIVRRGMELHRTWRYGVMTVHDYPPFYNGFGAAGLHRRTCIPFVSEIHHIVGYPDASSFTERIGRWMSRRMLQRVTAEAAAVRVVNGEVARVLASWGVPRDTIVTLPSFYLDAQALRPLDVAKQYDIVCCARLVANKGLDRVIDAVTLIPDATLLIIGDGPERAALERRTARRGLERRVTFLGWVEDQQALVRAVQSARVFVMNSRSEGGPRVALEAMACGMPVIATPVGVMPDVLRDGENGIVTTGAPRDLADKLRTLLGDEALRSRLGTAARSILDRFERIRLVKEYADFLKSVAVQ